MANKDLGIAMANEDLGMPWQTRTLGCHGKQGCRNTMANEDLGLTMANEDPNEVPHRKSSQLPKCTQTTRCGGVASAFSINTCFSVP